MAYGGGRGIAPLVLNLGDRWRLLWNDAALNNDILRVLRDLTKGLLVR